MFITACIVLTMLRALSNATVKHDIKQELRRNVLRNRACVVVDDDKVEISDEFLFEDNYSTYVVVKKSGKVIAGSYPKEIEDKLMSMPAKQKRLTRVPDKGEEYYVKDIRIAKVDGKAIFVRGIIKKSDVYSVYRTIEIVSCLSIIGVFLAIVIFQYMFARRISKELTSMCEKAEVIGRDMNMTERMEYDGRIHEVEVLVGANNRMLERIEKTMRMQEQFSADVAHELRTPVAVIMAECQYAQSELDKTEEAEEFRETLDVVHRQSKKINDVISQLLKFSLLDQENLQMNMEEIDLGDLTAGLCRDLQKEEKHSVTIRKNLQEAVIEGDINLISIVIQNLLSNAIKFSPENSTIEVSTGETEDGVFVSVKDYGIGIEKEEIDCIFRRFYKCEKSRNQEGFGLGLSLTMKIVQKHGGTIRVDSEKNKGSTFTVYFNKKI